MLRRRSPSDTFPMSSFAFLWQHHFLRVPALAAQHRFGIAGLAWDGAVTNRPGARFGPRAIRATSHMLCDGTHPHFDLGLEGVLGDAGDLAGQRRRLER
jgi:agmatinase